MEKYRCTYAIVTVEFYSKLLSQYIGLQDISTLDIERAFVLKHSLDHLGVTGKEIEALFDSSTVYCILLIIEIP